MDKQILSGQVKFYSKLAEWQERFLLIKWNNRSFCRRRAGSRLSSEGARRQSLCQVFLGRLRSSPPFLCRWGGRWTILKIPFYLNKSTLTYKFCPQPYTHPWRKWFSFRNSQSQLKHTSLHLCITTHIFGLGEAGGKGAAGISDNDNFILQI